MAVFKEAWTSIFVGSEHMLGGSSLDKYHLYYIYIRLVTRSKQRLQFRKCSKNIAQNPWFLGDVAPPLWGNNINKLPAFDLNIFKECCCFIWMDK